MNIKLQPAAAFTLLEMILALGVAAIVLVAVNAMFFTALHLRGATQNLVDDALPIDQVGTILRRDLACIVTPKTNTTYSTSFLSGDFRVGNISSPGVSLPVTMEMYTASGALSETQPWGEIQKVTYELKDSTDRSQPGKDLIRSVTRNLLVTTTPDVDDQWMMGGVASFTVSCFDGSAWQPTWDTTDPTSSTTNLPLAVRVDIQMTGNDNGASRPAPIEFLIPIDSQSRTNS